MKLSRDKQHHTLILNNNHIYQSTTHNNLPRTLKLEHENDKSWQRDLTTKRISKLRKEFDKDTKAMKPWKKYSNKMNTSISQEQE